MVISDTHVRRELRDNEQGVQCIRNGWMVASVILDEHLKDLAHC